MDERVGGWVGGLDGWEASLAYIGKGAGGTRLVPHLVWAVVGARRRRLHVRCGWLWVGWRSENDVSGWRIEEMACCNLFFLAALSTPSTSSHGDHATPTMPRRRRGRGRGHRSPRTREYSHYWWLGRSSILRLLAGGLRSHANALQLVFPPLDPTFRGHHPYMDNDKRALTTSNQFLLSGDRKRASLGPPNPSKRPSFSSRLPLCKMGQDLLPQKLPCCVFNALRSVLRMPEPYLLRPHKCARIHFHRVSHIHT